jgi:hypothetical protein
MGGVAFRFVCLSSPLPFLWLCARLAPFGTPYSGYGHFSPVREGPWGPPIVGPARGAGLLWSLDPLSRPGGIGRVGG